MSHFGFIFCELRSNGALGSGHNLRVGGVPELGGGTKILVRRTGGGGQNSDAHDF